MNFNNINILDMPVVFGNEKVSKIPKNFHLIWVGDEAPSFVSDNLKAWKTLMPDWEFYFWTNSQLTEEYFDADVLEVIFKSNYPVEMADIIRYYVVEKYGGVYMDADVTPHRSLDPILNLDTKVILCHELDVEWEYMSVGFFAATQNHPLFKLVCKRIKKALLNTKEPHLHTGPKLFGQCVSDVKLEQPCTVLPTKYFYKNMRDTSHIGEYNGEKDYDERFGNHFFSKDWGLLKSRETNYELGHHINIENFAQDRAAHSFMKRELEIIADQSNKRILDIGGGPQSMLLDCFNFAYGEVVDPINYPKHIKKLKTLYPASNIHFTQSTAEDYWCDALFDEVWCYNVLAHTDSSYNFFHSLLRNIKKGGIIRIMEPWNPGYEGHPLIIDGLTFEYLKMFGTVLKQTEFNANNEKLFMNTHYVLILKVDNNNQR